MQAYRLLLTVAAWAVVSCGGSSSGDTSPISSPPPPPPPPVSNKPLTAGTYDAALSDGQTPVDHGAMTVNPDESSLFAGSQFMGFGKWSGDSNTASTHLTMLIRGGLNEVDVPHSPGAQSAHAERSILVHTRTFPDVWEGEGGSFRPAEVTAPPLNSIPSSWTDMELIPFDHAGDEVNYTVEIDVSTAGELTGFDSNGCTFSGRLTERTDNVHLYDAQISASNCAATDRFIENADYLGHAYLVAGPDPQSQQQLAIVAINTAMERGVILTLLPQ